MGRRPGVFRAVLPYFALLASLALVVWRQSRALEALRELEGVRESRAVLEAERAALVQQIQQLESRGRVVTAAQARLGLRVPAGREIVILPLGGGDMAGGEVAH